MCLHVHVILHIALQQGLQSEQSKNKFVFFFSGIPSSKSMPSVIYYPLIPSCQILYPEDMVIPGLPNAKDINYIMCIQVSNKNNHYSWKWKFRIYVIEKKIKKNLVLCLFSEAEHGEENYGLVCCCGVPVEYELIEKYHKCQNGIIFSHSKKI